jgi:2-polyprenyl-6-methoxyphenol hydroxylase-like FAD-dependent oxidoreductase
MYDAIVVGARCAGSPTALLLARKGYKVLLVDRSTFPSDLPFSTHYIHQSGTARLQRWGLLDEIVASNCPPITTFHFDFGAFALTTNRVVGIRGREKGSSAVAEEARIVVGADGMNSMVARAVLFNLAAVPLSQS